MNETRQTACSGDAGQTLPLVALALTLAFGIVLALARLAPLVDDAARAQTAADAAALAGAAEGRAAAERYAIANGGRLVLYDQDGATVHVQVRVGQASADASARFRVDWIATTEGG